MDKVYKALADKQRRRVLEILQERDMPVGEIATHFAISGASLSHHLDVLKRANLVVAQRQGQFIIYSLNTSVFEQVVKQLLNLFGKE